MTTIPVPTATTFEKALPAWLPEDANSSGRGRAGTHFLVVTITRELPKPSPQVTSDHTGVPTPSTSRSRTLDLPIATGSLHGQGQDDITATPLHKLHLTPVYLVPLVAFVVILLLGIYGWKKRQRKNRFDREIQEMEQTARRFGNHGPREETPDSSASFRESAGNTDPTLPAPSIWRIRSQRDTERRTPSPIILNRRLNSFFNGLNDNMSTSTGSPSTGTPVRSRSDASRTTTTGLDNRSASLQTPPPAYSVLDGIGSYPPSYRASSRSSRNSSLRITQTSIEEHANPFDDAYEVEEPDHTERGMDAPLSR